MKSKYAAVNIFTDQKDESAQGDKFSEPKDVE